MQFDQNSCSCLLENLQQTTENHCGHFGLAADKSGVAAAEKQAILLPLPFCNDAGAARISANGLLYPFSSSTHSLFVGCRLWFF